MKQVWVRWLLPLGILVLWQIAADSGRWSSYVLPSPMEVINSGWQLLRDGTLLMHIGVSLGRVATGFLLAAVTAVPLAFVIGLWEPAYRVLGGTIEFFRHVPPLALLPLLILWLGIGEASKTAVVFLATFYPIFLNALTGVRCTDAKLLEMGRQYGLSSWQCVRRIRLPYAVPYVYTGLRIGLGYSWRSLIGAEMIAAASGVGYLVLDAQAMAKSASVIVGVVVIGVCGSVMDYGCRQLGRRLLYRYLGGDKDGVA